MFESIIEFFNTSLATLTIYDILVTILFALALILTIASGLIILSAKVKRINLEIEKNNSIQFINEKIIQNRLDLILSKIRTTENYLKDNQFTNFSRLTNNNIKTSIIENEQNDQDEQNNHEILDNKSDSDLIAIPYVKSSTIETKAESNSTEEALAHDEEDNSKDFVITYNTDNTNDDNNKFDDGQSIPIKIASNLEITNNQNIPSEEKVSLETNNETLEQNVETNENSTKDLVKANEFLNSMDAFKNDDKFQITENIKDDGTCIKCFVRNQYYQLTYKELIRQLLIQNLITHYNYPLRMISLNYRLSRSIDVAVIKSHTPYIIALIDNPNKPKRIQLLKDLTLASNAKFAIWCNGHIITCYSMNNGYLEEISDIPSYQEDISNSNNNTSYKKDRSSNRTSYNNGSFYRDTNNIYRNTNTDTSSVLGSRPYLASRRSSEYKPMYYGSQIDNRNSTVGKNKELDNTYNYNTSEYFSRYPYGPINHQNPKYRTKIGGSYTGSNLGYLNNYALRNQNSTNNSSFVNRMR